jgi:DHA2 family methylenomycin A resistance protein-like MFS transporter
MLVAIAMFKINRSLFFILIATCLGFLVVQLDVSVVNVGLATLKSAFDMDFSGLQWVINSYALVFSAFLILGGMLGDKFGAKAIFICGFFIFTVASMGCGLANSMTMLIVLRAVQGLGAALLVPTSLTLIRLSFADPIIRRWAVAMWGACGGIALATGPVMGGLMIQYFGWRSIFIINVPIGMLAIWLIAYAAPPSVRIDKRIDALGQITIAICLSALTYAVTGASTQGWCFFPTLMLVLAIIFAIAFVSIERKVEHPMLPVRLAKNPVLCATALSGAVINLTFYGIVFALSIYFQTILNYSSFRTGLAFIPLTAVLTISTMTSSRIARQVSDISIITSGFSIQIIGFIALSQLKPDSSLWLLNIPLMLVGIGSAISVPSITHSMLMSVSQYDAGIASGLMASARQMGGVIGVAVFGALISQPDVEHFSLGMSRGMLFCALLLLVCIGVNFYVANKRKSLPTKRVN